LLDSREASFATEYRTSIFSSWSEAESFPHFSDFSSAARKFRVLRFQQLSEREERHHEVRT